jgi:hypothetical protein
VLLEESVNCGIAVGIASYWSFINFGMNVVIKVGVTNYDFLQATKLASV